MVQPTEITPTLSLRDAAKTFGYPTMTLARKLQAKGIDTSKGLTVLQVHTALMGSLDAERIRETSARADLLELERQEKQRDLVPLAEVQQLISDAFLPVRQRLMALPAEQCARCNPSDPQLARESLDRWLTDSLPLIRSALPKPKKKGTK
jgi:hypothetical protein